MNQPASPVGTLRGTGRLHRGGQLIGTVKYLVHIAPANGQATVVQFEPRPDSANEGDLVHLTLEDGRVVNCQILDDSPYCAVVGDGPVPERRKRVRNK